MVVELWLKSTLDGEWVSMDLTGDVSISLTKSFEEIEDFTTRNSTFSKTFTIPQSAKNNRFFVSSFMVNSSSFADYVVVDAVVKYAGADVFLGQARLSRIINDVNGGTYEIFLTQSLPDFTTTLQNVKLIDLDLSETSHQLNYSALTSTWNYSGGSYDNYSGIIGKIVYPMGFYGYEPDKYSSKFDLGVSGFTFSGSPMVLDQFAPWVNCKYLLDKTFEKAGFTYDSDFLNSDYFSSIFALAKTNNTMGVQVSSGASNNQNVFLAEATAGFYDVNDGTNYGTAFTKYFYFNQENNDPLNIFTPSLTTTNRQHFFTTAVAGTYRVKLETSIFTINTSFPLYLNIGLKDLDDGTLYGYTLGLLIIPGGGLSDFTLYFAMSIPAGRRVGVFYSRNQGGGNFNADIGIFRSTIELLDAPNLSGTQEVLLQDNLPGEISALDYFRGIVGLFNLVVIPSGDRNFLIEKWDDYFSSGDTKNWSQKLDIGSPYTLEPTNTLQQEYIISYAPSTDRFSSINQQDRNQQFGTYRFISNVPYHTGVKRVEIPFQPLPIASYDYNVESNVLIPHIYTWNQGADTLANEYTPLGSGLRLGFYNGKLDFTITGSSKTWYLLSGATSISQTTYPAISHLSSYEFSASTFSDLNIGNQYDFWQVPNDSYVGYTSNDVWNNFWAPRVQPLYDTDVKILEGNFILTPTDINNLQFNDRVYFLDAYWRLLDMTDADITQKSSVSCRWIKQPYYPVPTDLIPPTFEQSSPSPVPTPTGSTFTSNVYISPDTFALCDESAPLTLVYSNCSTLSAGCSVFSDSGAVNPLDEGTLIKPVGQTTIYQVIEYGILTTFQNC